MFVCGGTRILTLRVEAYPDGVHFEVQNRLGADTGFSVLGREGDVEGEAPKDASVEYVRDVSLGRARAGCEEPPSDGLGKVRSAELEDVDSKNLHKSVGLECPGGMAVGGDARYAPGPEG